MSFSPFLSCSLSLLLVLVLGGRRVFLVLGCIGLCSAEHDPLSFISTLLIISHERNEILTPPISSLPPHLPPFPPAPTTHSPTAPKIQLPLTPSGKILRMVRIPLQILPRLRARRRRRTLRADPPARKVNRGGCCCCR